MKISQSIFLAVLSINTFIVPQKVQANLFRINIDEIGGDVVFSFDGSIDTSEATVTSFNGNPTNRLVTETFRSGSGSPAIWMGGDVGVGHIYTWGSGNVPAFGTNPDFIDANDGYTVTSSGDTLAMYSATLVLPQNYDGSNISGGMTFASTSFSELGITSGSYSWGLGDNNMQIVANSTPVPGPFPILGVPVVFYYYKKLKRIKTSERGKRSTNRSK